MKCSSVIVAFVAIAMIPVASGAATDFNSQVFGYEDWLTALEALDVDSSEVVYPFSATPEMKAWADEKLMYDARKVSGDIKPNEDKRALDLPEP